MSNKEKRPLTKEERLEMSRKIMNTARKHPEFMAKVRKALWKAERRILTNYN